MKLRYLGGITNRATYQRQRLIDRLWWTISDAATGKPEISCLPWVGKKTHTIINVREGAGCDFPGAVGPAFQHTFQLCAV